MVTVAVRCRICKEAIDTGLSREMFAKVVHRQGHIQDEFPEIPADIRELFISGVCDKCLREIFGDEEERLS